MKVILYSVVSAFMFAITFLLRKQAARTLSLQTAYIFESITQIILLVAIFALTAPELKRGLATKEAGIGLALLAGITVTMGVFLNYLALKSGLLSRVVTITSPAQIIFGVLLGLLLAGENVGTKQGLGIILSIAGILLIVSK